MNSQRNRHVMRNTVVLVVSILLLTAFISFTNPSSLSSIASAVPITGWTDTSRLPSVVAGWNAIYHDEHVYLVGGRNSAGQPTDKVYMAKLTASGPLGDWGETTALPEIAPNDAGLFLHAAVADDSAHICNRRLGWRRP